MKTVEQIRDKAAAGVAALFDGKNSWDISWNQKRVQATMITLMLWAQLEDIDYCKPEID